jgi:phosphate transport system substrate-binding protein
VLKKGTLIAFAAAAAFFTAASSGIAMTSARDASSLKGAGSSFVSPLVSTWVAPYDAATGVHIDYSPIGSGGGIAAITNRTVDFGASDAPMSPDQFANCKGCVQIPWALSATSIAYNLDGVSPHLKLTGKVLADIYLGKVTKWNDAALQKLNPGASLPDMAITPIFRSDSSGTSFNFTDYLSKVNGEFAEKVGTGTQVNFPVGVGGKGSSGVSAVLARTKGGIIYVDIAFALRNHFSTFRVQNSSGKFALPGLAQIKDAASTVKSIPADNSISIVNPPKTKGEAYPICTFTYVIVPLQTASAPELKRFIFWALTPKGGQSYGPKLLFAPIPKVVLVRAEQTLKQIHA